MQIVTIEPDRITIEISTVEAIFLSLVCEIAADETRIDRDLRGDGEIQTLMAQADAFATLFSGLAQASSGLAETSGPSSPLNDR